MQVIQEPAHTSAFMEGTAAEPLLASANDVNRLIEACMEHGVHAALLYSANLPANFFDLSSGVAGHVLQKLRTYRIRLAVVCLPGSVSWSARFDELLLDERRGRDFGVFDTREAAVAWMTD